MRKILLASLALILCAALGAFFIFRNDTEPRVTVAGHQLTVEVARTISEQQKGLSDRDGLAEGRGMIFVYDHYHQPEFWMKDMRFPIDIIWIRDTIVADISSNIPVPTSTNLMLYAPKNPINYVLEVPAGWAAAHGVTVGSDVSFMGILDE